MRNGKVAGFWWKCYTSNIFKFRSQKSVLPLQNLTFVIEGKVNKDSIKRKIQHLGGRVDKKVNENIAAVISDEGKALRLLITCSNIATIRPLLHSLSGKISNINEYGFVVELEAAEAA